MNQLTYIVPIPPAEPPEIDAFTTVARLIFLETQNELVRTPTHNLCMVI